MNYIKELNLFKEWLFMNQLPTGSIALWYALMSINNAAGWKRRFTAPNATVGHLSGLSRQGIVNARKQLVDYGLIRCEKGWKGKAPSYEMISLATYKNFYYADDEKQQNREKRTLVFSGEKNEAGETPRQIVDTSMDTRIDTSLAPNLNIHKQKRKQERRDEEKVFQLYEMHIGRLTPFVREEISAWVDYFDVKVMCEAIKVAAKYHAQTFGYIEKILLNWISAGVSTLADIASMDENRHKKRASEQARFTAFSEEKSANMGTSVFDLVKEEMGI